ncbi:MAG: diguanylate cyclase [bacterium]
MKKSIVLEKTLVVHQDPAAIKPLFELLEIHGCAVTFAPDTEAAVLQPNLQQYRLIIVSDALRFIDLGGLLKRLREGLLTGGLPVLVITQGDPDSEQNVKLRLAGAAAVVSESVGFPEIASLAAQLIARQKEYRLDPVTGLVAGPFLDNVLERLCSRNTFSWYFLEIKLLSLKAINYQYGYDSGDEMMARLAEMLEAEIHLQGTETDFAGRLYGTRFCVVSRARNIDSLCRNIITKSGRVFRKFYTPFEWMKGHVTVEGGKKAGNYHLCDVVIAALQVPSGWDNNRAYLLDIADEVLMQIPKSKNKYLIVNP